MQSFIHLLMPAFDTKDVPGPVLAFVEAILGERRPIGVIYYGSSLWKKDLTGLLDFYIVCDCLSDWHNAYYSFSKVANAFLPPNVEYYEWQDATTSLRAKVAILSLDQFRKATSLSSIDTTMWARFCQPTKILWWRGHQEKQALLRCLIRSIGVAVWWAAYLGPQQGKAEDYWYNLFRNTYRAELRVEAKNRPVLILEGREKYFIQLLKCGWQAMKIHYRESSTGILYPQISKEQKILVNRKWQIRARLGRPLNILRLIKAAFTFKGGAHYIIWKINRHRQINLQLNDFQKKHPLVNAPWLLFKLYRQGVFQR